MDMRNHLNQGWFGTRPKRKFRSQSRDRVLIFGPSPAGPGTDSSFSVPVPWVPRKMGPVPSRPGTGPWDASHPIRSQVFEDIPKILSKFDTLRILVATVQASLLLESKETMSDIPILIKNYRFLEYG